MSLGELYRENIEVYNESVEAQRTPDAINNFKYILSAMRYESLADADAYVQRNTAADIALKTDTKSINIITAQFLINDVCEYLLDAISKADISRKAGDVTLFSNDVSRGITIKLHGGSIIESNEFADAVEQLNDSQVLYNLLCDFFVGTRPQNSEGVFMKGCESMFSLIRKATANAEVEAEKFARFGDDEFLITDYDIKAKSISKYAVVSAFTAYLLRVLVFTRCNESQSLIRINKTHTDLLIGNDTKKELVLTPDDANDKRYFHINYQSITFSEEMISGTIPLRSNGMFDLRLVEALIRQRLPVSRVCITNWVTLDSAQDYLTLNNLNHAESIAEKSELLGE